MRLLWSDKKIFDLTISNLFFLTLIFMLYMVHTNKHNTFYTYQLLQLEN